MKVKVQYLQWQLKWVFLVFFVSVHLTLKPIYGGAGFLPSTIWKFLRLNVLRGTKGQLNDGPEKASTDPAQGWEKKDFPHDFINPKKSPVAATRLTGLTGQSGRSLPWYPWRDPTFWRSTLGRSLVDFSPLCHIIYVIIVVIIFTIHIYIYMHISSYICIDCFADLSFHM